jgi:hypothetical protein
MISVRDSKTPLTEEVLRATEERLGIVLPEEYRSFLLIHNGGHPTPDVFKFGTHSGRYSDSCVAWFLAIYDGEYSNFETYFMRYKLHQQRLPSELVAIARDPGGNLVCIAVDGAQKGAIFFWDHEQECGDGDRPTFSNVYLIADSFSAFLSSLHTVEY